MNCVRQTSKVYTDRSSPPYLAEDCPGQTMKGNNGKMYISEKRGSKYKWYIIKNQKESRRRSKRRTSKKSTMDPKFESLKKYIKKRLIKQYKKSNKNSQLVGLRNYLVRERDKLYTVNLDDDVKDDLWNDLNNLVEKIENLKSKDKSNVQFNDDLFNTYFKNVMKTALEEFEDEDIEYIEDEIVSAFQFADDHEDFLALFN